jgi:hypothetical protein
MPLVTYTQWAVLAAFILSACSSNPESVQPNSIAADSNTQSTAAEMALPPVQVAIEQSVINDSSISAIGFDPQFRVSDYSTCGVVVSLLANFYLEQGYLNEEQSNAVRRGFQCEERQDNTIGCFMYDRDQGKLKCGFPQEAHNRPTIRTLSHELSHFLQIAGQGTFMAEVQASMLEAVESRANPHADGGRYAFMLQYNDAQGHALFMTPSQLVEKLIEKGATPAEVRRFGLDSQQFAPIAPYMAAIYEDLFAGNPSWEAAKKSQDELRNPHQYVKGLVLAYPYRSTIDPADPERNLCSIESVVEQLNTGIAPPDFNIDLCEVRYIKPSDLGSYQVPPRNNQKRSVWYRKIKEAERQHAQAAQLVGREVHVITKFRA